MQAFKIEFKQTKVIYDRKRMENALAAPVVRAPENLSLEEKRRFILQHAQK